MESTTSATSLSTEGCPWKKLSKSSISNLFTISYELFSPTTTKYLSLFIRDRSYVESISGLSGALPDCNIPSNESGTTFGTSVGNSNHSISAEQQPDTRIGQEGVNDARRGI